MFIDTDPIKEIYLIEFRSSVAKFYCRNSIKQTVIEFYRNPSDGDFFFFFRGSLFYDMAVAREMDQFFSFFARACNGVHGCKFDGLYDWDRSRLMGNPFSSVLSFDGRNLSARIIMRREIFRLLPFDENDFMEIILVLREKISSRTRQVNKYQFLFFFLFDYYYFFFFFILKFS